MRQASRATARRRWAATLDCDPERVFAPGLAVTGWDGDGLEVLAWPDGAVVAAPAGRRAEVRAAVEGDPGDVDREWVRSLAASVADVERVHGPQFVGYCDRATVSPVGGAARVEPSALDALRDACGAGEWERSGLAVGADRPTFAVVADGRPVAASQYALAEGVATLCVASHPAHRGEGHATAAVSAAVEHALDRGALPEYRTLERWSASVTLAERVGFQRVARSFLADLA